MNGKNYNDGTSMVTQCPIIPGHSYQYDFTATSQVRALSLATRLHINGCNLLGGNILVPLARNNAVLRWLKRCFSGV